MSEHSQRDRQTGGLRHRIIGIYALLAVFNLGAWLWALVAFHSEPLLLSMALVAWGFGLRHAVDADHIAAIDNVTRNLMQDGRRPVTIGFFFALGHSAIVVLVAAAVAGTAAAVQSRFEAWREVGGIVSTGVSATFLFLIAAMNVVILRGVWRTFRHVRRGGAYVEADLDILLSDRGILARCFKPLFRLVSNPIWMLPLGALFGLGFDTATEISLLGISASQAAHGLSVSTILVFPLLFSAGIALVDTTDGILMLGVYEWAFVRPIRKLYYNLTITLVSVVIAVVVGGIEALALLGEHARLKGGFWTFVDRIDIHFDVLGLAVVGIVVAAWLASYAIYKAIDVDRRDTRTSEPASLT